MSPHVSHTLWAAGASLLLVLMGCEGTGSSGGPERGAEPTRYLPDFTRISSESQTDEAVIARLRASLGERGTLERVNAKLVYRDEATGHELGTPLILAGVTSLAREEAEQLAYFPGDAIFLPDLQVIDSATAKALAKWSGSSLHLDGLTRLDLKAAKQLRKWRGDSLHLNGLTKLDPEVADELQKWRGKSYHLNGLSSIEFDTLDRLLNPRKLESTTKKVIKQAPPERWGLYLDGIIVLDSATLKLLSGWRGIDLSLDGLAGSAQPLELSEWKGKRLSLNGFTSLTSKQAEALCQWRGSHLALDGLTSLSDVSEALSQWPGESLSLDGVVEMSIGSAYLLAGWKGKSLSLNGLISFGAGGYDFVVTAGVGDAVWLWDIANDEIVRKFVGPSAVVDAIAISPDGKHLASVGEKRVSVWSLHSGKLLLAKWHKYILRELDFSPDGKRLVIADAGGQAMVWDLENPKLESDGQTVKTPLLWLGSSPERKEEARFAGATWPQDEKIIGHLEGSIRHVKFSPDGNTVATAGNDNTVRVWNAETGSEMRQLGSASYLYYEDKHTKRGRESHVPDVGHGGEVHYLAFSPDGSRLASASLWDDSAIVWAQETGEHMVHLRHDSPCLNPYVSDRLGSLDCDAGVRQVVFSPDGSLLATVTDDGTARLWDVKTGEAVHILKRHAGTSLVNAVAFSPDQNLVATGAADDTVRVWHVATGHQLARLSNHMGDVWDLKFSPDGKTLATVSEDGRVGIWRVPAMRSQLQDELGGAVEGYRDYFESEEQLVILEATRVTAHQSRVWDRLGGQRLPPLKWVHFVPNPFGIGLAAWKGKRLELNGITQLDAPMAAALGAAEVESIKLGGLDTASMGLIDFLRLAKIPGKDNARLAETMLSEARALDPQSAKTLLAWEGETLDLSGVTSLALATVKILVEWQGKALVLDGLTQMSDAMAKVLTTWKGYELSLGGLRTLSPALAKRLASWKGKSLRLNGLQTLEPESTRALAWWRGDRLSLESIDVLRAETATALSDWHGKHLSIGGVSNRDPSTVLPLMSWKGSTLRVHGVKALNHALATNLSRFRGDTLDLQDVESVDERIARALVKFYGVSLEFNGRVSMSDEVLNIFEREYHGMVSLCRGGGEPCKDFF